MKGGEQNRDPGVTAAEGLKVSFPSMAVQVGSSIAVTKGLPWYGPGLWHQFEVVVSFFGHFPSTWKRDC